MPIDLAPSDNNRTYTGSCSGSGDHIFVRKVVGIFGKMGLEAPGVLRRGCQTSTGKCCKNYYSSIGLCLISFRTYILYPNVSYTIWYIFYDFNIFRI